MSFSTFRHLALFFAMAIPLSFAQTEISLDAPTTLGFTNLHTFQGGNDGSRPLAPLLLDPAGNLWGTTSIGGSAAKGTIFEITASGTESVFYTFQGGSDGAQPFAGLIRDDAGNLYGTTDEGGGSSACPDGCGTVFEITPTGHETILHRFQGNDGQFPFAGLVRDSAGSLYGATTGGGTFGLGVIFKISSNGHFTQLYNFTGGNDGSSPAGTLVRDSAGNLYGTTTAGAVGLGTVFRLAPSGQITVLHTFLPNGIDGQGSWSGLVRDSAGNLFGTTISGGKFSQGTIFKVAPSGQEHILYTFVGSRDGGLPQGTLSLDNAGNLYGTTQASSTGSGVVFRLDTGSHETILYTFSPTGTNDGAVPQAGVVRDSSGVLYGTTEFGGSSNSGVVFKLTP